jgi:ADP-heptose:LPS heptosyltransferase
MFYLGVPQCEIPRAKLFVDSAVTPSSPYVVIHAFASAPEKAWPADRFVEIAERLRADGLEPVFLCGPGDDVTPFVGFENSRGQLRSAKALLRDAALFIGNDSGPAHMAAAFGIPVVVLYGPSDPVVWAPWKTESRVFRDLPNVTVDQVTEAATALRTRVKA